MALLIYDGMFLDPRAGLLEDDEAGAWMRLLSRCASLNTDTLTFDDIADVLARDLGSGDLWEIEE